MATTPQLPKEIAVPEIPAELPPNITSPWTPRAPKTWAVPDIPVEITFPLTGPKTVRVPLTIKVGRGTFQVALTLSLRG